MRLFFNILRVVLLRLKIYRWLIGLIRKIKLKNFYKDKPKAVNFIVYQAAVWKCQRLYELAQKNDSLDIELTIIPMKKNGEYLWKDLEITSDFFSNKNMSYKVFQDFDNAWKTYKFFRKSDILIFSDCWNLAHSKNFELLLLLKHCVYIPYAHQVTDHANQQPQYNQIFHNLMVKIYATHKLERQIYAQYSAICDDNVEELGYPGVTAFIDCRDGKYDKNLLFGSDPWSFSGQEAKARIIWGVHHSINWTERGLSNFLRLHDFLLQLVKKYVDDVIVIFKPHPMLRESLYCIWGRAATDAYYQTWGELENGGISEGSYDSLFAYSDALIHDCGSFIAEYSYLGKHHAFIQSSPQIVDSFNQFGRQCLDTTSKVMSLSEIEDFFATVIRSKKLGLSSTSLMANTQFYESHASYSRDCEGRLLRSMIG